MEVALPNLATPKSETVDPSFWIPRTLTDEPRSIKFSIDKLDPKRICENAERLDPNRPNERKDREEPRNWDINIDRLDPMRMVLNVEIEDPNREKDLKLRLLAKAKLSSTEIVDPNRT
jgi:hypothetical protein